MTKCQNTTNDCHTENMDVICASLLLLLCCYMMMFRDASLPILVSDIHLIMCSFTDTHTQKPLRYQHPTNQHPVGCHANEQMMQNDNDLNVVRDWWSKQTANCALWQYQEEQITASSYNTSYLIKHLKPKTQPDDSLQVAAAVTAASAGQARKMSTWLG